MDEIERTERKSSMQATSCFVNGCILRRIFLFIGRADFDFFIRFENAASCINASMTYWLEPTLFACVVAL